MLVLLGSVTILQRVQLTGGGAACETTEGSPVHRESAASSRLGLWCEGLSKNSADVGQNHSIFTMTLSHRVQERFLKVKKSIVTEPTVSSLLAF